MVILLIVISLYSINVVYHPHCAWSTHDLRFNLHRYAAVSDALGDGQWTARWTRLFNHGYGYPLLLFYPPASPMLIALMHRAGPSILDSMKVFSIIMSLAATISAYCLGRALVGPWGAFLTGLVYTLLPYRLETLISRGAIAEYAALGLLPLLWLAFIRLGRHSGLHEFISAACLSAGMLLFHNATWLTAIPVSIALSTICSNSHSRARAARTALLAALAGMCLSSYYLVPSILEMRHIQIDNLTTAAHLSFRNNMLPPARLWVETWPYAGAGRLFTLLFVLSALLPFRRRDAAWTLFFRLLPILLFAMMLDWSLPVWECIKPLQYIQFPWRLSGLAGLSIAVTIGGLGAAIGNTILRGSMCLLIAVASFHLYTSYFFQHIFQYNETHELSRKELIEGGTTAVVADEYQPVHVRVPPHIRFGPALESIAIEQGSPRVFIDTDTSTRFRAVVIGTSPSRIRFNCVHYPGWTLKLDEHKHPFDVDIETGLMVTSIPEGLHTMEWVFMRTPARWIADLISLCSLTFLFFVMRRYRNSRPVQTQNERNVSTIRGSK